MPQWDGWTITQRSSRSDTVHPVSVTRFPSFRTQPLENLSHYLWNKRLPSNPAPGEKSSKRESCYGDRVYQASLGAGTYYYYYYYYYYYSYYYSYYYYCYYYYYDVFLARPLPSSNFAEGNRESNIYIYIYIYIYVYVYVYIYIYIYIYIYVDVYNYIYIYIYIITHMCM